MPEQPTPCAVINPATGEQLRQLQQSKPSEVDAAVHAARRAFGPWAEARPTQRATVLSDVLAEYRTRMPEIADSITAEMGAPRRIARGPQVQAGERHLGNNLRLLDKFEFERQQGDTLLMQEPIGVVGMITPWNWPIHQILCKVAPALAGGCTMVLKPSEVCPTNAQILAEVLAAAGLPEGVFNLVLGSGATVGRQLAEHPGIDMISFTGSTRAGVDVAVRAAPTVKRITQELGGKSANILLPDADLDEVLPKAVAGCFSNSGQSCNAPTRLLVPEQLHDQVVGRCRDIVADLVVGDPTAEDTAIGPVANSGQFDRVQNLIEQGITEGADLVIGGPGRPDGLTDGYFVRPTVFGHVSNRMTIAQTEIFGPVLSVIRYRDTDDAVRIANDTEYGLSALVQSADQDHARTIARRLRAGQVVINGAPADDAAPFGGYKRSGNGREKGPIGLAEFLEHKALIGHG